jgi:predicted cupin superfamily sugar epimerase
MNPQEIVAALGMQPHPEGGWYVETFRDAPEGGRGLSTAIYFLLERDQVSAWHRVRDAAELWHYHAGAPLALTVHDERAGRTGHVLGLDFSAGQRPQAVVPAGAWQTARSLGAWTLVGCTVAPGFDFSAFELAEPGWQPGSHP